MINRRCTFPLVVALAVGFTAIAQTPSWKASVVSMSNDSPQFVSGAQNWPGRPAGHRWIALTVQMTSPSKDLKVAAADIIVFNQDGSYVVTAVSHQVKPTDSIVYLPLQILAQPHADKGMQETTANPKTGGGWSTLYDNSMQPKSVGFFEKMDINKMLFNVLLKGTSGGREVQVTKSPLNLVLLFAVPQEASKLQLKFGDAEAVPLPVSP